MKKIGKYHFTTRRLKTTESYETSVIMVTDNLSTTSDTFARLNRTLMGIRRLYSVTVPCWAGVAVSGPDL